MSEINLSLSVQEAEFILNTLGRLPYGDVYPLIHKIQSQAGTQLQDIKTNQDSQNPNQK